MKILITGGNGLVGKYLAKELRARKHEVRILTRSKTQKPNEFYWNLEEKIIDEKALIDVDSIIHLAGAKVSKRWTNNYKKELYSSRIDAANLLLYFCKKNNIHLKSFISASGINYYGTLTSDQVLSEDSKILREDFLAKLSLDWEKAAEEFHTIADRIVCLRTAVVLSKNGGAFETLKKLTDFNLSSAIGSGNQWMNWIHVKDLVNIYIFAVENPDLNGSFNAVADEIPTNSDFMKTLAKVSKKFFLPINVPAFILKLNFGEMSEILLTGTRASNKKIKSLGFDFKYSNLKKAFESLL